MKKILLSICLAAFSLVLSGQEVFYDGFEDENNPYFWRIIPTGTDLEKAMELNDGFYEVSGFTTSSRIYTTIYRTFDTNSDFEISAGIKSISTSTYGYGILFGFEDDDNHQAFNISSSGYFKVGFKAEGVWSEVKTWEKKDVIKTGDMAYNVLKIVKQGHEVVFLVNDEVVYTTVVFPFAGLRIGFVVHNQQSVGFDYLRIRYLNSNENFLEDKELFAWDMFIDNSANWPLDNRDEANIYMDDGCLFIDHKREVEGWMVNKSVEIDESRDYEIKARFKKTSGVDDKGYGLLWGMDSSSELYLFTVASNKYFTVGKYEKGSYSDIFPWEESNVVHKHVNAVSYNELTLRKIGNMMHYIINGTEVKKGTYQKLFGKNIGFVVYGKQEVGFDFLTVSYLD